MHYIAHKSVDHYQSFRLRYLDLYPTAQKDAYGWLTNTVDLIVVHDYLNIMSSWSTVMVRYLSIYALAHNVVDHYQSFNPQIMQKK